MPISNIFTQSNYFSSYIDIKSISVPSSPSSGIGRIFHNSADGKLYFKKSNGTTVDLESGGGGGGTVESASNVGAGSGWFKTLNGTDLEFKSLIAGSNQLSITSNTNDLTVDVVEANIKLDDLGAPDDNTDLNASTTKHGLLLKLSGNSTDFLNGQGAWAVPSGSGSGGGTAGGTSTQSGDAVTTVFTIAHGLGETPNAVSVEPSSVDALGDYQVDFDATNITITYQVAPPNDTGNLTWIWIASVGGSGEANTLTNVGGGNEFVKAKAGVNYDIRTLIAGTDIGITENTNDITIAAGSNVLNTTNTKTLTNKTIDPTDNTIPYLDTFTYTIYQDGGAVKTRNNKTGAVASDTSLGPAMATVLASGDPSVEIQSGTYNLASGFAGWTPPTFSHVYMQPNTFINVPQGYNSYVWGFTPNGTHVSLVTIDGGSYSEQGTASHDWDVVYIAPIGGISGAVLHNTFQNIYATRPHSLIHIVTNAQSWANTNSFRNCWVEKFEYGILFEHIGTYTRNASGPSSNYFEHLKFQAVGFSAGDSPEPLGGIIDVIGQYNMFNQCEVWDIFAANASAPSMTIAADGESTTILGGVLTHNLFTDAGFDTHIIDTWQGVYSKTPITIYKSAASSTAETLLTAQVDDASGDSLTIENLTTTNSVFNPLIRGTVTSAGQSNSTNALYVQGIIKKANDTSSTEAAINIGAKNDDNTVLANRPMVSVLNLFTPEYSFYPTYMDFTGNGIRNATIHSSVTGIVNANIDNAAAIATSKLADGSSFVTLTGSQTLTNKTLTSPVVNSPTLTNSGNTLTLPTTTTTIVGHNTTNTLTNKTFDADGTGNSITNIENADIKAGAAIATSKLADSANFAMKNTSNTFKEALVVSKTAQSGTEPLLDITVDDASGDYFTLQNLSGTNGLFAPIFRAAVTSSAATNATNALYMQGIIKASNDTASTEAAFIFGAKNDDNTAIVNRPMLSVLNLFTPQYLFYPTYMEFADARDIKVGTTTGTKIGTSTSNKLAFYGSTPIVQGSSIADISTSATGTEIATAVNAIISRLEALGLIATV